MPDFIQVAPRGVGGLEVQSLTSYLRDFSAAEARSIPELLLVVGAGTLPFDQPLHHLDGRSQWISRVVDSLQRATGRGDLRRLTFLDSGDLLAERSMRDERAWCPDCRREARYDRLIWSVSAVRVCWRHQRKLVTLCARCRRTHSPLQFDEFLGTCPHCGAQLDRGGAPALDPLEAPLRDILGAVVRGEGFSIDGFAAALADFTQSPGARGASLAQQRDIPRPVVAKILRGERARVDEVALVLAGSGRRLGDFLAGGARPRPRYQRLGGLQPPERRAAVEQELRDELAKPASSQRSIGRFARDHGTDGRRLHREFPTLASALAAGAPARMAAARRPARQSV